MSAQVKDGGSAFPVLPPVDETGRNAVGYPLPESGMTLRDYFAAHIIQGMMANPSLLSQSGAFHMDNLSAAWEAADAMLRAREVQS